VNVKTGIVSMFAAAALTLVTTAGTAMAGEGRGHDRGRSEVRGGRDGGGFHGNRREVHRRPQAPVCRPQPPVCRPAPRCDDRPRYTPNHGGWNARFPRGGGFVIVFNGGRDCR
jgi:hypothetical protein